jgi:hypothetical protein
MHAVDACQRFESNQMSPKPSNPLAAMHSLHAFGLSYAKNSRLKCSRALLSTQHLFYEIPSKINEYNYTLYS